MKKKILIFGITGQDASYLAELLIKKKNYIVFGVARRKNFINLKKLNILKSINIIIIKNFNNEFQIQKLLKKNFDQIYFLGGQQSVIDSFSKKEYQSYESNIVPVKSILEYIRKSKKKSKFLFAASSEMYGYNKKKISEKSPTNAYSPYGLSKIACFEFIKSYRMMFNLPVFSIIFFNHESPLRRENYVFKKIIKGAKNIKDGKQKKIILGNINVKRDWGWVPEFMNVVYKVMKKKEINDYVLATGKTSSLKDVINLAFKIHKLNWKKHVSFNKKNFRKNEIPENYADISLIKKKINWKPKFKLKEIIHRMSNSNIL